MRVELKYKYQILDRDGKVVKTTRWRKARSFVKVYVQHLRCCFAGGIESGVLDMGNTSRNLQGPSGGTGDHLRIVGDTAGLWGLVVGSGDTAVTQSDYALETQIAHGVGAGQLSYGATSIGLVTVSGDDTYVLIPRSFTNGSGSSIDVKEIGCYCRSEEQGGTNRYFMVWRDVLAATEAVANGQTIAVTYTLKVSN